MKVSNFQSDEEDHENDSMPAIHSKQVSKVGISTTDEEKVKIFQDSSLKEEPSIAAFSHLGRQIPISLGQDFASEFDDFSPTFKRKDNVARHNSLYVYKGGKLCKKVEQNESQLDKTSLYQTVRSDSVSVVDTSEDDFE